jgi:myo-inositol-1(or 4)-monophosphatase
MTKRGPALNLKKEFNVALKAILGAGQILQKGFRAPMNYRLKGAIDLVTEWDLKSQEWITSRIKARFPDHDFLVEEGGLERRSSSLCWVLDPLDGTTNFVHGFPVYCVSLALLEGKEILLGLIHNPELKETYWAIKGQGAFCNGRPIRVSAVPRISQSLLATGFPYNIKKTHRRVVRRFENVLARSQGVRRPGSAAMDLCWVAGGVYDGFWEEYLKPWDTAAGILLVEEAGGRVTDFSGRSGPLFKKQILATNGQFHQELLELLKIEGEVE